MRERVVVLLDKGVGFAGEVKRERRVCLEKSEQSSKGIEGCWWKKQINEGERKDQLGNFTFILCCSPFCSVVLTQNPNKASHNPLLTAPVAPGPERMCRAEALG